MPFREPYEVDKPGFPNTAQPTTNVGIVGGNINVQGGGEKLFDEFGSMEAGTQTFLIEAPPSGLTYFGIGVMLENVSTTGNTDVPLGCRIFNFGTDLPAIKMFACNPFDRATYLGNFGHPFTTAAAVPVATKFPITIELEHFYGQEYFYHLVVVGLSQADVRPRDLGMWETINLEPRFIFNNAADESYCIIAASFEGREFLLTQSAVTTGADFLVDVLGDDGTWTISQTRAHNSIYGGKSTASGAVAETNSLIVIPGNGAIHRIRNGTDNAGNNTSLTYLGMR